MTPLPTITSQIDVRQHLPPQGRVTSEILDRLPPQNVEAEKNVLGCLFLDIAFCDQVSSILKPGDFWNDAHATLYGHLLRIHEEGKRVDATLLIDRLTQAGDLEAVGGTYYLTEIAQCVPYAKNAQHYAEIVRQKSVLRNVIDACTTVLRSAYDAAQKPESILAQAESLLSGIRTGCYQTDPVPMFDAVQEAMLEIDEILAGRQTPGIPTGLTEFDGKIGGVFPGELSIIAARPGQGKTSLAIQIAAHIASLGYAVYFATLEMSKTELAMKRLCSVSGVSSQRVRSGRITVEDQRELSRVSEGVASRNLHLHDWPEIRPYDIQRAARRLGAQVIFVDYLQYVTPPDAKKKRYEQVGDISKQIKTIAREMQVPVVACAQIGRQADQGKESRPKLSHLRESGNIENDCDMAVLLWRPEDGIVGKKGGAYDGDKWDAELEVAKNRKGETAKIHLDWDGSKTLFSCHEHLQKGEEF